MVHVSRQNIFESGICRMCVERGGGGGAAFSIRSEKNYIGRSENFSLLLFPVLALIFLDYSHAAAEYMEANKTIKSNSKVYINF